MPDIPEGQLSRAAVVGSTAVKIGLNRLQTKAKSTFSAEHTDTGLDDKSAQQLFEALIKLRGTAIKLAQMLGMEAGLLPEKLHDELKKSWHQVPPLNRVLVRKVLLEEFNTTADKLYAEFDASAFAAASLGQVHAAKLQNGSKAAVKIQYPGIHVAMQSDIKLLRKLVKGLPVQKTVSFSIDEIEARLTEELDYLREADRTTWFRENIKTEGVFVPAVYPELSTARVLTTEFMEGKHLDEWLNSKPPQETCNLVAQRLYDSFAYSVHELRMLHADPNPGNYLFHDDGSVALIDFGCTRDLSERFVGNLPALLQAYLNDERDNLRAAYSKLGMQYGDSFNESYENVLRPFGRWLTLPFQNEYFDFGENPTYTSSARDLIHKMAKLEDMDSFAEEFIFFDRTIYGLCKIFERLRAKVRMRHHWGLQ